MGSIYQELDDGLREFIAAQHIYFVASAPLSEHGHVNVSPKGLDSLRILGPREVAYLDLTGSGIETVAHVRENGRLTLMFCAFQGRPRIVRLQGRARIVEPGATDWDRLAGQFPRLHRLPFDRAAERRADCRLLRLRRPPLRICRRADAVSRLGRSERIEKGSPSIKSQKNRQSIDGLPGLSQLAKPQP